jgi:hypothetical protein
MQKVKLVKCNEGEGLPDLTIGKVYEGWFSETGIFAVDKDDVGEQNELYIGEFEVVDEE